ncbi:tail assembly protein [Stenotrophomonas sp. 24(2023)]|uniref:tail assembly protein n=1 Tax=Stenotrophomonas sp. 24(2023) TaxID=3068324 RepID=UPI0027DED295|nr:tail assembly protein [Stenotrophomonas sp. 24(2023)]WMJ68732.1 tail assembly protein [Stenotrophomonas sp. 24(2023)]
MTERMRTIRLYGELGRRFGREHRLAVANTAEAVRALGVLHEGFQQYLLEAEGKGVQFVVFIGRQNISEQQLLDPPGSEVIKIAPVLIGAKGGALQTIVGAALWAVATYMTIGAAGFALAAWSAAANMGVALALGGVSQMLAPVPKGVGSKDKPENQPSYSMNGTVNTQAQGGPVPLAYGGHDTKGMMVGSAIISGGIYAEDQL